MTLISIYIIYDNKNGSNSCVNKALSRASICCDRKYLVSLFSFRFS